jgi:VCBS repeat-containing protein
VQQLNAGDVVHDTLEVTSLDGTATTTIDVTITGSNDAATITGATSGSVTEDAVPNTASGDLNSTDVDNANDSWNVVSSPHATANSYGTYTIDATGHWTYTLDNTNAAVNGLSTGATLTDTFTVTTVDGTSQLVSVTINGHTDVAPRVAPTDVQLTPQTPPDSVNFNSFTFSGTLTATDPDPGAFTFTILSQTGSGNFAINGNTLSSSQISQSSTYGVTVHTVQTGDPAGLFWDETFTIITGGNGNNDNTLNGVSGDDVLYGNTGNDMLFGLAGNDTLFGQDGADRLTGGSGNDTLWGGGGNDVFVLDSVAAGDVDTIADYGSGDTIDIRAVLSVSSGTNVLTSGYLRVTTTGLIQIDANGSATGGQVWTTIGHVNTGAGPYAITYLAGGVATTVNVTAVAPPIALDLDGDGKVSFVGIEAGTAFDYGYGKVGTAWVAGNDGILVCDGNHDGQVSVNEMVFSTGGSDLEGLAVYDSNHDGQLNSADSAFADFAVWQDANGDGQVDAGELHSLADEKIAGISLSSDGHSYVAADGDVTVVGTGSFTRTDGSTGVLADSVFATVDQGAVPAAHGAWSMMASMADYIASSDDMQALMAHVGADAARSSIPDASAEAHAMLVEAIDQPGIEDLVAAFIESGGKENGGLAHVTSAAGLGNSSLHQQASPVSGVPEQSEIGSHDLSGFGLTGVGHNDFAMQLALAQHP